MGTPSGALGKEAPVSGAPARADSADAGIQPRSQHRCSRAAAALKLSPGSVVICSHEARDTGAPSLVGNRLRLPRSAAECLSQSRNRSEGFDFLRISPPGVGTPSVNPLPRVHAGCPLKGWRAGEAEAGAGVLGQLGMPWAQKATSLLFPHSHRPPPSYLVPLGPGPGVRRALRPLHQGPGHQVTIPRP